MLKRWKYLWISLSVLFGLLLMFPFILNYIDLNQFKQSIETRITELTGRQLKINGDLQFNFSLHPFIRIEKVSFANAHWSKQPQMLAFDVLHLQIELLPLLEKQLVIDQLLLKGLVLVAEKNIDGQSNWLLENFSSDDTVPDEMVAESTSFELPLFPVFKQVQLDDNNIYYGDIKANIETSILLESLHLSNPALNEPFIFRANGTINEHLFNFDGETNFQAASTTRNTEEHDAKHEVNNKALSLKLNANAIGATLSASGVITQPFTDNGIDIEVSFVVPDLDKTFSTATGKSLKQLSINTSQPIPLQISAKLTNRTDIYHLRAIKFTLADSDLNGEVSFSNHSNHPEIKAKLYSEKININQLLSKASKLADNKKIKPANKNATIELPDTPLPFELLDSMNANISYIARKILVDDFTAKAIKLNAVLQKGKLQINQFDFDLGSAPVRSSMSIYSGSVDSQSKTPKVSARINIKKLDLAPVAKRFKFTQLQQGRLNTAIKLESRGDNLRSLLLGLHGNSNIQLNQIKASQLVDNKQHNIYIEKFNLNFTEMKAPLKYAMKGTVDDEIISLSGELTTLTSLLNNSATNISAKTTTLESVLAIDSRIQKPLIANAAQINIALTIPRPKKSLDRLTLLIPDINTGNDIPDQPVSLNAQLNISANNINAKKIKLNIGKNDLTGEVTVNMSKNKPVITANLSSQLLDIDSLLPPTKKQDRKNKQNTEQKKTDTNNRLFSTEPLPNLDALDSFNATVHYQINNLTANNQYIKNIWLDLTIDEGQLQLKPLTLDFADGKIKTELILSEEEYLRFQTSIEIQKLSYDRLMAILGTKEYASGDLDAEIHLQGMGDSVSTLMAGLNGQIRITAEDGNLNRNAIQLLSTNLSSLIPFTDKSDRQKIRCAVIHFNINNGIAETHALVLDTGIVSALGSGKINLATETLSLHIDPRSKRTSVMKLALVPLNVEGPLTSPSITPDAAGTTISATNKAAHLSIAFATGGISLVAEGFTDEMWKQFIDDTDYCELALTGEKVVPTLTRLMNTGEDLEENENDADFIEELNDDYGGF